MSADMTIAVYRVDPVTGKRTTVREKTWVLRDREDANPPEALWSSTWPLCACPRCRGQRKLPARTP